MRPDRGSDGGNTWMRELVLLENKFWLRTQIHTLARDIGEYFGYALVETGGGIVN